MGIQILFLAEINYQKKRWFLYDNGLRHERVILRTTFAIICKIKHLIYQDVVEPTVIQVVAFIP